MSEPSESSLASVTKEILRNESDLCRAFHVIAHVLSGRRPDISLGWIATFNADKLHRRASSSIGVSPAPRTLSAEDKTCPSAFDALIAALRSEIIVSEFER